MKCRKCKTEFDEDKNYDILPVGMTIFGVAPGDKFPKCPKCGQIDFTKAIIRQPIFKRRTMEIIK